MTPKQAAFVREYLADPGLNASAAYMRAYPTVKPASARVQASRMLADPNIASAIAEEMEKRAKRTQIDADWVLKRLHADANADLADIYDTNGHLKPVNEWPMTWRTGLVAGVETVMERDGTDEDGKPIYVTVRKVKLADRTRIVELAGKHVGVGAFKDRIEHSGEVTISDRIKRAEERAAKKQ